ncbi:MAG: Ribose import permease protein RbsC [Anaerolineales bacterium]|nr:Ribose import permease protein RbsC [Anaerolineales bacterium]
MATTAAQPRESTGWSSRTLSAILRFREASIIMAFLALCLFFWWRNPNVFLKPANLAVIMRFVATFGLLAIGEVLVIITGGIDLSVGSMTALTGVLVATLMMKGIGFLSLSPLGIAPSIVIVLIVAGLVGSWHGLCVTKLGIPPFIITLGTWLIARGAAAFVTRGYPIVFPSDFPFLTLGQGEIFQIPIMFVTLVVVAVVAFFILTSTTLGRHIYAVGGNIEAARVSGVNVDRVRIFSYVGSGTMAGLVGILWASRLGQGTPTVGSGYELWAIAATVIGGTSLFGGQGTVLGAILGAAIMGVMINGMVLVNLSSYLQDVVLGVVLVIAVTYDTWRRRQ